MSRRLLLVWAALLPAVLLGATGFVSRTFEFSAGDFAFSRVNGYDVVLLPGQATTTEPGRPCLPLACLNVVIPPDAEVTRVEVTEAAETVLPGTYDIHPVQRPYVLSRAVPAFVAPDPAAYSSDKVYPAEAVRLARSGLAGGYRVAGFQVVPLRYLASRRELRLATRLAVRVEYESGRHPVLSSVGGQAEVTGAYVRGLVANPDDVTRFAPVERQADDWLCDMIVLTSSAMSASFQPFVNWKTLAGYKTAIVRTESIYANYPGRDNPEKIRNCIIDYWQHHGLKWVLVGGDDQIVPVRTARLTVEGNVEDIATDMYYADLQYSWDSDHNNLFGEMTDSVDFFHDVFVGRVPVDDAADVGNFFAKCTTYERHPDSSYIKKVLYGSTMLFDPYHGRVPNHLIAALFPVGWQHAHLEDPNYGVYADSMDRGFALAHVAAHGNPSTFSVMDQSEVSGLTNGMRKLNFVNSIACQSGWFDGQECLAEELMNCTTGGCIALMLNSRYGFGYPPGLGPSEMLDIHFYRSFVNRNASQFGTLGAMCKDYFQSLSMGQEVWRWCVYELNLMGDPTLSVWSERPRVLTVERPDSALVGAQVVRVTVRDGSTPKPGALVCLSKGSETYARGRTNSLGWVDLVVAPTTSGNANLSASLQDYFPYQALVPVRGSTTGPALVFAGLRVDDGGNGRLDPGETASLFVSVANAGASSAGAVTARLRTNCPWLTLVDSTAAFGTIASGATVEGEGFVVTASAGTPPGMLAEMVAACTASEGYWEPFFSARIGEPPPPRKAWADHDTGEMILSVTSVGSIGTMGPYREGSGLKYPRTAGYGSIYFTSFACSNGPGYVVDRWYGQPASTFQTDWRTLDTLHAVVPPVAADEEYQTVIDDGAHAAPRGLTVTQWSGALADPRYRDFVVIQYGLENRGTQPINGLYCGILSDFDVLNTSDNNVRSDAGRRFVYMTQEFSEENSVGVKLLSPTTAANLSAIDHAVYVTPGSMMTEAVKDSFLRGLIVRPTSNRVANWSCVASAGPLNLAPGGRTRVAFALVGGNSQAELLAHADSAQSWYDHRMPNGLCYLRSVVDDAAGGNNDGIINPGESINLPLWVVNRSDRGTSGVWGILRKTSGDTLLTVTDSVRYLGVVSAGDSAFTGPDGYRFRVAAACTNRYVLPVQLVCVDTLDSVYTSNPGLVVGAPQLIPAGLRCWDPVPGGNNNGRPDPGENAEIALGLANAGLGDCAGVLAVLRSGDARLVVLDSLGAYGDVLRDSTVFNSADRYRISVSGSVPPETQLPCTLLVTGVGYSAVRSLLVPVGVLTALDPIPDGPRQPARFYAYDDVDAMYAARPQFNWVELRGSGTRLDMSDDETQVISLPAGFGPWRYYGQSFAQISICSNGWVAPGSTTSSSYTNEALPSATAPCMVAADWDDLYPPEGGGVWYWHDAANHRFIVEWESMPYYSNRTTFDQFEIVIYDTTVHSRAGDNVIDMQYLAAAGFGSNTVGLQDPGLTIGIQCLFDGAYHRAAAPIGPGRCIRFTTDSAVVGVADRSAAGVQLRPGLALARNPFSRGALLRATTPEPGARVTVYDASGRAVRVLAQGLGSGVHELVWDGLDQRGRSVANGVYLLRLDAGAGSVEQKAVLIR